MLDLLSYMLGRGNVIDIGWFLVGAWLLVLFLLIMGWQLLRALYRKINPRSMPDKKRHIEKPKAPPAP